MAFFSKLRAKFRRSSQKSLSARRSFEPLEQRRVLTSYLFVDFGDNFTVVGPDRTLTTTVAELRDVATEQLDGMSQPIAGTVIQGAQLTDPDTGANYADGDTVSLTKFTFTTLERARVIAQLQRAYLPFDVTIVDLTATGQTLADGRVVAAATSIADVIATLRANNTTSNDAYIIVASPEIGADNENPNDDNGSFGYGGIAATGTVLGDASDLQAGSNLHDDLALVFRFDAETIAHEAGHTYGLQHSVTDDPAPGGINGQIHTSEVMSYLSTDKSWYFTNFPMVEGDGNTDNDTLQARGGAQTPADQLFNDVNVGANTAYYYITGTGAHDIITITRNGVNADITIQAFANDDYTGAIEVPGSVVNGSVYTYTVALDRALLIYAGLGDDKIILDGDFGTTVEIKGMSGTDSVEFLNSAEALLTYTPSTNTALNIDGESDVRGSVVFGTTTVNYADFEGSSTVSVEDIATVTVAGSAGQDGLKVRGIAGHQGMLYGTVGIIGFVNIAILIYDDVTTLNINTGGDTDILTLEFGTGNPIPTTLNFDAGAGNNQLWTSQKLNGTASGWNTVTESSTDNNSGTITFSDASVTGTRTVNYDNINLIFSQAQIVNFVKNATAAADTITVAGTISGATITTFSMVGAINNVTINTLGSDDIVNVSNATKNLTINGGTGTNTISKTANLNFTLTDSALTTSDTRTHSISNFQVANLTGGAADNIFTISGWTGAGTIDGAGGTADKIISTKNQNILLSNTGYFAADGTNLTLANFEVADLTGGAANNNFNISGWTGTGTIDGAGGTGDMILSTKDQNVTLTNTNITAGDGTNLTLANIEVANLTGGAGNNSFTVSGWTGAGTIDGAGGTGDTLVSTKNSNVTLSNTSFIAGDGANLTLASVEVANLTGGAGNNTYTITGWTGIGTIDGAGGTGDTIIATNDRDVILLNTRYSADGGTSMNLVSIEVANLTGGVDDTLFAIGNWTGTGTINGAGGTGDKIVATKNSNVTLTNTSYVAGDGTNMTLANVEVADLNGGAAANEFNVSGWTRGGSINGNGGDDTIVSVKIGSYRYTAGDTLVSSTDGMNFAVSSIEVANLTGGTGANTFTIQSNNIVTFNLVGGGGPNIDKLDVDTTGGVFTYDGVGAGKWTYVTRKTIFFTGMETFDFEGNVTAVQSGATLTLTGDAFNNGVTVKAGAGLTVVVTGLGSTINGGTASVTFSGIINVVANMNNGNDYVMLNNLNLYNVSVNGGAGNDRLQMGSGYIPDYNDSNDVNYAISLGSITVRGSLNFTDNAGNDSALFTRTFGNANWNISTGDLADKIEGSSTTSNNLMIDAGGSSDQVKLDRHTANGIATVNGGVGADTLTLTNGEYKQDANVFGGDGADFMVFDTNIVLNFVVLDGGIDSDYIFAGGNTISKDLTIRAGAGYDAVFIGKHTDYSSASNTVRKLFLEGGTQADFIALGPNDFNGFFGDLGAGDDMLVFEAINNITVTGTLDGGLGNDQVHETGTPNVTYTSVTFF